MGIPGETWERGKDTGFNEPVQVSFTLVAAVLTAEILIPNSRYVGKGEHS